MKIEVYAHISPEYLYKKGMEHGLSEDAADYLRHFEEVEIDLHVDAENGAVCGAEITQDF